MIDMTQEIWKDIDNSILEDLDPKYLGHYQVSNYGRVHSDFRGGRILTSVPTTRGKKERDRRHVDNYSDTMPRKVNVGGKKRYVHRLVAAAFCEVPEGKDKKDLVVNHIDFNPWNNRADNLEWCTTKENVQWSYQHKKDQWGQSSTYEALHHQRLCVFDKKTKTYQGNFAGGADAAHKLHLEEKTTPHAIATSINKIQKNPLHYTAYSYYWIPIDVDKIDQVKTFEDAQQLYEGKVV